MGQTVRATTRVERVEAEGPLAAGVAAAPTGVAIRHPVLLALVLPVTMPGTARTTRVGTVAAVVQGATAVAEAEE